MRTALVVLVLAASSQGGFAFTSNLQRGAFVGQNAAGIGNTGRDANNNQLRKTTRRHALPQEQSSVGSANKANDAKVKEFLRKFEKEAESLGLTIDESKAMLEAMWAKKRQQSKPEEVVGESSVAGAFASPISTSTAQASTTALFSTSSDANVDAEQMTTTPLVEAPPPFQPLTPPPAAESSNDQTDAKTPQTPMGLGNPFQPLNAPSQGANGDANKPFPTFPGAATGKVGSATAPQGLPKPPPFPKSPAPPMPKAAAPFPGATTGGMGAAPAPGKTEGFPASNAFPKAPEPPKAMPGTSMNPFPGATTGGMGAAPAPGKTEGFSAPNTFPKAPEPLKTMPGASMKPFPGATTGGLGAAPAPGKPEGLPTPNAFPKAPESPKAMSGGTPNPFPGATGNVGDTSSGPASSTFPKPFEQTKTMPEASTPFPGTMSGDAASEPASSTFPKPLEQPKTFPEATSTPFPGTMGGNTASEPASYTFPKPLEQPKTMPSSTGAPFPGAMSGNAASGPASPTFPKPLEQPKTMPTSTGVPFPGKMGGDASSKSSTPFSAPPGQPTSPFGRIASPLPTMTSDGKDSRADGEQPNENGATLKSSPLPQQPQSVPGANDKRVPSVVNGFNKPMQEENDEQSSTESPSLPEKSISLDGSKSSFPSAVNGFGGSSFPGPAKPLEVVSTSPVVPSPSEHSQAEAKVSKSFPGAVNGSGSPFPGSAAPEVTKPLVPPFSPETSVEGARMGNPFSGLSSGSSNYGGPSSNAGGPEDVKLFSAESRPMPKATWTAGAATMPGPKANTNPFAPPGEPVFVVVEPPLPFSSASGRRPFGKAHFSPPIDVQFSSEPLSPSPEDAESKTDSREASTEMINGTRNSNLSPSEPVDAEVSNEPSPSEKSETSNSIDDVPKPPTFSGLTKPLVVENTSEFSPSSPLRDTEASLAGNSDPSVEKTLKVNEPMSVPPKPLENEKSSVESRELPKTSAAFPGAPSSFDSSIGNVSSSASVQQTTPLQSTTFASTGPKPFPGTSTMPSKPVSSSDSSDAPVKPFPGIAGAGESSLGTERPKTVAPPSTMADPLGAANESMSSAPPKTVISPFGGDKASPSTFAPKSMVPPTTTPPSRFAPKPFTGAGVNGGNAPAGTVTSNNTSLQSTLPKTNPFGGNTAGTQPRKTVSPVSSADPLTASGAGNQPISTQPGPTMPATNPFASKTSSTMPQKTVPNGSTDTVSSVPESANPFGSSGSSSTLLGKESSSTPAQTGSAMPTSNPFGSAVGSSIPEKNISEFSSATPTFGGVANTMPPTPNSLSDSVKSVSPPKTTEENSLAGLTEPKKMPASPQSGVGVVDTPATSGTPEGTPSVSTMPAQSIPANEANSFKPAITASQQPAQQPYQQVYTSQVSDKKLVSTSSSPQQPTQQPYQQVYKSPVTTKKFKSALDGPTPPSLVRSKPSRLFSSALDSSNRQSSVNTDSGPLSTPTTTESALSRFESRLARIEEKIKSAFSRKDRRNKFRRVNFRQTYGRPGNYDWTTINGKAGNRMATGAADEPMLGPSVMGGNYRPSRSKRLSQDRFRHASIPAREASLGISYDNAELTASAISRGPKLNPSLDLYAPLQDYLGEVQAEFPVQSNEAVDVLSDPVADNAKAFVRVDLKRVEALLSAYVSEDNPMLIKVRLLNLKTERVRSLQVRLLNALEQAAEVLTAPSTSETRQVYDEYQQSRPVTR